MVDIGEPCPARRTAGPCGPGPEAAELVAGLEDAIGGRGRLFLIAGEPGIGRTWLAEHLAGLATERGIRVLWGGCWEAGGAPPFWPWTQLLGALVEDRDEEILVAWLGAGAVQVAQLVPGGTVALSRNVSGKPSKVEALLHGRAPRKGRTTRPCP
jgi:hypothetical protein